MYIDQSCREVYTCRYMYKLNNMFLSTSTKIALPIHMKLHVHVCEYIKSSYSGVVLQ